ncbi:MAG: hypothetical protein Q9166_001971 [cf. Caloplaca sp. 2 TL-2023]
MATTAHRSSLSGRTRTAAFQDISALEEMRRLSIEIYERNSLYIGDDEHFIAEFHMCCMPLKVLDEYYRSQNLSLESKQYCAERKQLFRHPLDKEPFRRHLKRIRSLMSDLQRSEPAQDVHNETTLALSYKSTPREVVARSSPLEFFSPPQPVPASLSALQMPENTLQPLRPSPQDKKTSSEQEKSWSPGLLSGPDERTSPTQQHDPKTPAKQEKPWFRLLQPSAAEHTTQTKQVTTTFPQHREASSKKGESSSRPLPFSQREQKTSSKNGEFTLPLLQSLNQTRKISTKKVFSSLPTPSMHDSPTNRHTEPQHDAEGVVTVAGKQATKKEARERLLQGRELVASFRCKAKPNQTECLKTPNGDPDTHESEPSNTNPSNAAEPVFHGDQLLSVQWGDEKPIGSHNNMEQDGWSVVEATADGYDTLELDPGDLQHSVENSVHGEDGEDWDLCG